RRDVELRTRLGVPVEPDVLGVRRLDVVDHDEELRPQQENAAPVHGAESAEVAVMASPNVVERVRQSDVFDLHGEVVAPEVRAERHRLARGADLDRVVRGGRAQEPAPVPLEVRDRAAVTEKRAYVEV